MLVYIPKMASDPSEALVAEMRESLAFVFDDAALGVLRRADQVRPLRRERCANWLLTADYPTGAPAIWVVISAAGLGWPK